MAAPDPIRYRESLPDRMIVPAAQARLGPPWPASSSSSPWPSPGSTSCPPRTTPRSASGSSRADLLELLAEDGGWDALVVRSQTRVDAELLAAAAPRRERRRRGKRRDRPDRRRGGDARRGDDRQRPDRQHHRRRRAHHGAHARPASSRGRADASVRQGEWDRRQVHRQGAARQDARASSASARSARRSRAAPPASRCASSPATPT